MNDYDLIKIHCLDPVSIWSKGSGCNRGGKKVHLEAFKDVKQQ